MSLKIDLVAMTTALKVRQDERLPMPRERALQELAVLSLDLPLVQFIGLTMALVEQHGAWFAEQLSEVTLSEALGGLSTSSKHKPSPGRKRSKSSQASVQAILEVVKASKGKLSKSQILSAVAQKHPDMTAAVTGTAWTNARKLLLATGKGPQTTYTLK